MEKFKKAFIETTQHILGMLTVFIGVILIALMLGDPLSFTTIIFGLVGIWILSPAIDAWRSVFASWFNRNKN